MGFKREITDAAGVTHPEAYYKVTSVKLDAQRKQCAFRCSVWHDHAARLANGGQWLQPLSGVQGPVGFQVKNEVNGLKDFDNYFDVRLLDAVNANPYKQAYAYIKAKLNDPRLVDVDPDE